jgi:hypothetical protein
MLYIQETTKIYSRMPRKLKKKFKKFIGKATHRALKEWQRRYPKHQRYEWHTIESSESLRNFLENREAKNDK